VNGTANHDRRTAARRTWSLLDTVTVATVGVACGVLFAGWNLLWGVVSPLFAALLPLQYLLFAGTWVIAGPLAGLVVRRPGAALAGEVVAASVSFLLASQWSVDALFSGAAQGLGAELALLAFGYRRFGVGVALLAGALSGVGMALHDLPLYFAGVDAAFAQALAAAMIASSALVGGLGAHLIERGLRRSGALPPVAA
jgi:energy-coupling factor transport system substrate-specific component